MRGSGGNGDDTKTRYPDFRRISVANSLFNSEEYLIDIPKYSPSEIWILGFGYSSKNVILWMIRAQSYLKSQKIGLSLSKVSEKLPVPLK